MTKTLISENYLEQQKKMHENPQYGTASLLYAPIVADFLKQTGAKSLLDYGAGKMHLNKAIQANGVNGFAYFPYDPAFPEYGEPREAACVCCIDVLEHIEEQYLDNVLDDLHRLTKNFAFMSIDVHPAEKTLPDGRNAHLIQKPTSWWLPRICRLFEFKYLQEFNNGFWFVVTPIR